MSPNRFSWTAFGITLVAILIIAAGILGIFKLMQLWPYHTMIGIIVWSAFWGSVFLYRGIKWAIKEEEDD